MQEVEHAATLLHVIVPSMSTVIVLKVPALTAKTFEWRMFFHVQLRKLCTNANIKTTDIGNALLIILKIITHTKEITNIA